MATILLIEDDAGLRRLLRFVLEQESYKVLEATTGPDGISAYAEHRPDLVISDVVLPGLDGLSAMQQIKAINPFAPVVVMTGDGTTDIAIRAMSLGASEYLVKPFDPKRAVNIVRQILAAEVLEGTIANDTSPITGNSALLGKTDAMYDVFKLIGRVANQSTTVLILGESGTGKELVARAIHEHGSRKAEPFVVLNCAAIPESLLESELFGYEKGAFTGADRLRQGKFELANDGTLFLDEIGDMSPSIQAKLLRVLQDQEFYRVGGGETIRTNVRIVAATNRDLRDESIKGRFREDLLFRLGVSVIRLPPLRKRRDDIPLLVHHFLKRSAMGLRRPVRGIAPAALDFLCRAEWRGNVRELSNVIYQAVLLAPGTMLMPEQFADLNMAVISVPTPVASALFDTSAITTQVRERIGRGDQEILPPLMAEFERAVIRAAIDCCGENISLAAKHLGMHRVTLKTKLSTYDTLASNSEITE